MTGTFARLKNFWNCLYNPDIETLSSNKRKKSVFTVVFQKCGCIWFRSTLSSPQVSQAKWHQHRPHVPQSNSFFLFFCHSRYLLYLCCHVNGCSCLSLCLNRLTPGSPISVRVTRGSDLSCTQVWNWLLCFHIITLWGLSQSPTPDSVLFVHIVWVCVLSPQAETCHFPCSCPSARQIQY